VKQLIVKKNRYVDSVTLMSVGDKILRMDGIENAEIQMGTLANQKLLADLGYQIPADIKANDLILAVSGNKKEDLEAAFLRIEDILDHKKGAGDEIVYKDIGEINLTEDGYDLVQISLPGQYAYEEAEKALEKGLHVFIFSDNVSLEDELKLKKAGREKGLIVMGPDCGVGMFGGVCLGVGSIMKKGPVGIVAASGSGAQEAACIIERCGYGISEIIGTGGRDLTQAIGGIGMLQGMERLLKDEMTKVIVLVSKLADLTVMEKVLSAADQAEKPIVAVFLGGDETLYKGHKVIPAYSLEEAALKSAKILNPENDIRMQYTEKEIETIVAEEIVRYTAKQKYFRGLYCGGTFAEEGLIYFGRNIEEIALWSNLDTQYAGKLEDFHKSREHSVLDMGAEDFTNEAPHPVFDPLIRIRRLKEELEDEEVAVILLDFITGPGVAGDPFTPVTDIIRSRKGDRHITYIANICGSDNDPQNISEKKKILEAAGVIVTGCNYESARLSGALMKALKRRGQI